MNFSKTNYTGDFENDMPGFPDTLGWKTGFNAGFQLELDYNDEMSFYTGFSYESRGEKVISARVKAGGSAEIDLDQVLYGRWDTYFTIPLMARFNTIDNGNESFLAIGLETGFLNSTSAFSEVEGKPDTGSFAPIQPDINRMNTIDLAWMLQIGYEFLVFDIHKIHISASYSRGLISREKQVATDSENTRDGGIQNTNWKVFIGYKFDLFDFEFGSDDGSDYKYEDEGGSDNEFIDEYEDEYDDLDSAPEK